MHGTNIVDVKTLPGGQTLSPRPTNTVVATTGLAFVVTIQDSGDSQEVGIKVTLTIQKPQGAIVRTKKLHADQPGPDEVGHVRRSRPGPVRPEDDRQRRRRDRFPARRTPTNNKASYPVIFSLGCERSSNLGEVHDTAQQRSPSRSPASPSARSASALAWWAWVRVRPRARRAARAVGGGRKDLVDFAVSLQARIDDLHRAVDEVAAGLARVDRRVDATVTNTAIVRYDAYEDTGGHQSASLALLDSARTGLVLDRDPGPRLRPDLHEGARARPRLGRPLARGAGGRRARDGRRRAEPAPPAAVQFSAGAAGSRSQCELRAAQRVLAPPRPRARLQGQGRGRRGARPTTPLGHATPIDGPTSSGSCTTCACPRMVQRKISRRALFARDGWRCVYCGTRGGRLTLDHVIPRSRGGDSSWENVVTSCAPCNLRKGNRLPHEIQMVLPRPPAAAGAGALHQARDAEDPGRAGSAYLAPLRRRRTPRRRPPA